MDTKLAKLWAKTGRNGEFRWHPLILHMLDVAASAEAILMREPESTRKRIAACLGLEWEDARPWLMMVMASHDLGKACPGFNRKWQDAPETGLRTRRSVNTGIHHAYVSQIALEESLRARGWPASLAEPVADAVGCHHGNRATPSTIYRLENDARAIGGEDWSEARRSIVQTLETHFKPSRIPTRQQLSGPDFILLSGLTSFADWIGSNEAWFPFGKPEDCENIAEWFQKSRDRAELALDSIGWEPRIPLCAEPKTFEQVFGFSARSLQHAAADILAIIKEPAILLLEAPMGEGKTEAAFFACLELQRRFGHRGMYVALPTKATGNAMFMRTMTFLGGLGTGRKLDLQLAHGAATLNEAYQNLRLSGIHDMTNGGEIRAGEWFTHKKRALLSEYGVGTVDQALLPILPVRHNFVRMWGLSNRVVVFDEIHAYDVYTGTLLVHLLRWLLALGSSVVLLSATLPPAIRRKLAGVVEAEMPEHETAYPRLTVFQHGEVEQRRFVPDASRRLTLRIRGVPPHLDGICPAIESHLAGGGMALALVNTVQRAQDLYKLLPEGDALRHRGRPVGKRLPDGMEVFLFHARFPADLRQQREDRILEVFGKGGSRCGRKLLIATQVAEQSLDLDFDLLLTDLAPIDLLLQRAGRLWRYSRSFRPAAEPILLIAGLTGDEPPSFQDPLWWGRVYREDILLETWCLLRQRQQLTLPDDIDALVQTVYDGQVDIPDFLKERHEKASLTAQGDAIACRVQADQAIVGFPDDESWNEPARYILYDEDEAGPHRTLMAQTRLGDDSIVVVPLWPADGFDPEVTPDLRQARRLYLRTISLSRKGLIHRLRNLGIPAGWKKSALLRNCFPLELDARGRSIVDGSVNLTEDLGIVYDSKEDP